MTKGRKPTTGRYVTRDELVAAVWHYWHLPKYKQSDIARICRISDGTVARILNTTTPP